MLFFTRALHGLHLFDTTNVDIQKLRKAFFFPNTPVDQKSILANMRSEKQMRKSNHIAKDKFISIVCDNWIHNNPITAGDVQRSNKVVASYAMLSIVMPSPYTTLLMTLLLTL